MSAKLTPLKKVLLSVVFLALVIVGGTLGFILLEGWSLFDALYMTIITLSTVGFREVAQLSSDGRLFTMLLIVIGIGTVGYGIGNLTAFIVEGELSEAFKARKMNKIMEKMCDHVIICGYGNEGRHATEELSRSKVPFIVIEKDETLCQKMREDRMMVLNGDATDDDVLLKAGVATARGLIAAIPDDSENVFISLTARGFNPNLTIVSRASDEANIGKMFRAGANKVISSSRIGGRRMASAILRPKVMNFLDVIMNDQRFALRLEEIDISETSPFVGKSIRDLHIRVRTGSLVVGHQKLGEALEINPSAETTLHAGDVLIVLGNESQVEELREISKSKDTAGI